MPQPPQGPLQPYGQQPPQRLPQLYGRQPRTPQEARAHALAVKAHRKAMRPWFRKKRFIIPLALIALVVLAQLLPNSGPAQTAAVPVGTPSAPAPADPTSAPAQPKATKTTQPEPKPQAAGIGDTVKGGDWEFKITKFKCGVKTVGSQYLDKTAQGQFCLMNISVKNNGKQAETLNGNMQKIFDADDREFSSDWEASAYEDPDSNLLLEQINPGNTKKGLVIFDIPKGTKPVRAELAGGFLGRDPASVELK